MLPQESKECKEGAVAPEEVLGTRGCSLNPLHPTPVATPDRIEFKSHDDFLWGMQTGSLGEALSLSR